VTRGQLQQRAGSPGLDGGGAAAMVPPVPHKYFEDNAKNRPNYNVTVTIILLRL